MAEEFDFKSSGEKATSVVYTGEYISRPIGIKTPIQFGTARSGLLQMCFEPAEQVHDNLKNLLLTNHGERVGLFRYGANLRSLVSERVSVEDFDTVAMESIKTAISTFMPFVEPMTFSSNIDSVDPTSGLTQVTVSLTYNVVSLNIRDKSIGVTIHCMG